MIGKFQSESEVGLEANICDRTEALDALRGTALLGVLLVNLITEFRVPMLAWLVRFHTHTGSLNHAADWIVGVGIEGKAYAIFALLLGAGIAAQSQSGRTTVFFIRRFGALLAIGLIHIFSFFAGDILTLYALLGLTLIPFRNLPARGLFVASALAMLAHLTVPALPVPAHGVHIPSAILRSHVAYANGSFPALVGYRTTELREFIFPLLAGSALRTVAMILLGMASWRMGWTHSPQRYRARFAAAAPGLLVIGGAATAIEAYAAVTGIDLWRGRMIVGTLGIVALGLGYATTLLFAATGSLGAKLLRPIGRLGRMSLTSYLVQSIAFGFVFYGYGLGQYGVWGSAPVAVFGIVFYAAQVAFANVWLRRNKHGPVEGVWRRLSNGRVPS